MTKNELSEIRKRCKATTKGLWKISRDYGLVHTEITTQDGNRAIAYVWTKKERNAPGKNCEVNYETIPELQANAEFIANAKQDILKLLDYIEEGEND